jgi:uncharacterized Fe-S cluster protein YjdI
MTQKNSLKIKGDYPGKEITDDNRKICSHAAECVKIFLLPLS